MAEFSTVREAVPRQMDLELPDDARRDLAEILAELSLDPQNGDDLGDAIGAALSNYAFLLRESAHEKKIMIVDKNKWQRELRVKGEGMVDGWRAHRR
jgi:hypothetical protein